MGYTQESHTALLNGTYRCVACRKGKHYDCSRLTINQSACTCVHIDWIKRKLTNEVDCKQ